VQWATDPVWSGLELAEIENLLKADIPFLRQQLAQEGIGLLLLNGAGIVRAYQAHFGVHLKKVKFAHGGRVKMLCGHVNPKLTVIGWNINLQSSFGVSNAEITGIGQRINELAKVVRGDIADPDAVADRAVAAGGKVVFPVGDQPYGMRQGRIADPAGHHWLIGKPLR